MSHFKTDAGLIIPKRTGKISTHHDITIEFVSKWRKQHAHSDITTTAKDLFLMLQDMHQTNMAPKTRFEILLMLKPTISFLCDGLQKLYYRQEILSENLRAIADLVYALNTEMLNGYKLVLHDSIRPFFPNKNLMAAALANAMHFAIRILFHAFEQHRHPPKDSWHELHSLYLFGVKKKLNNRDINHSYSHSRFKNINQMYKHCLLFAISNPHRLRKEELAHLVYATDSWTPLFTLEPALKTDQPELFIVDIESDLGPKYTVLYREPTDSCYYLNMNALTEHLEELVAAQKHMPALKKKCAFSAAEQSLPLPFIESLLRSWQQMEERQHQRQSAQGYIGVMIGISNCVVALNKTSSLHTAKSNEAFDTSPQNVESINIDQLPTQEDTGNKPQNFYTCELVDKSEKGYCLKWMQEVPPKLICGEIIGLEKDQLWEIGTIRWLKHEENNVLLIGIQLLGKQAVGLTTRANTDQKRVEALLLPGDKQKSDCLITPTVPYKAGQALVLSYEGNQYDVHLDKNVTQTPSFQLFNISYTKVPLKLSDTSLENNKASRYQS